MIGPSLGRGELLHVEWDEVDRSRWAETADTLATERARPRSEAVATAVHLLAHFPGCAVVAVPVTGHRRCVLACRGGETALACLVGQRLPGRAWQVAVIAFLYARLTAKRQVGEVTTLRVATPAGTGLVSLTVLTRG